ncbi:peptide-N4-asparagine amidase [Streptomyces sp. NPDC051976]|uniref:peptide-N4-asparagine amidase n=1 Tax=Streptomyces sp. NPDC051976 TaxID=3154947 RepID=UPI00342ED860
MRAPTGPRTAPDGPGQTPRRPLRRAVRALLAVAAALALAIAGGAVATASAAAAAPASYVENGYQDPVTALPPVSRPDTRHCAVTVMRHDFANSYGQPYTGTVTPPADCPGPWAKVVLTWSGSVAGRQYDRLAGVWIGGAEVLRTSTPEPDDDGITWHVDKDVTAFTPLLRGTQPLVADLGNIVNTTYTGVYHMTLTLTYYTADRHHPAPRVADQVLPLSSDASPGWYSLSPGGSASKSVVFPRNLTGARLEVYARGGGCDEQWFDAVPSDLAATSPDFLCGGGPYREVQVAVDGQPAGLAQPYPVVYSGGIVPTLWRPIPAVDQFLTLPYDIDLTPFAGALVDGRPHTVTITPYGAADEWIVDGTLFLDTDHHAATTSGALTSDTLTATPQVSTTERPGADGATDVHVAAARDWHTEGYLDTSRGRITTRVEQHTAYTNDDAVSDGGRNQTVAQRDSGATTVTTSGGGHGPSPAVRHAWSYPIDVDMSIPVFTDGNNYDLRGTVRQQRILTDSARPGGYGPWLPYALTDDTVSAHGVLARDNGTVVSSDGTGSEHYHGTTDTGRCYDRSLTADHGWLTGDSLRPCRW